MKAVVLLSGGLDSSLALKLIKDQGIEVLALHFISPFYRCDGDKGCGDSARTISSLVGMELKMVHMQEEYLDIVKEPKHGRGKNLNPCIDCRIFKFAHAKRVMEEIGASFIVTGEVLGQRPMSQYRRAMILIEKEAELEGLVVRPLSAKVLDATFPEENGWVDRENFLNFQGRHRKPQIKLAEELGIKDYTSPAGGCLLTDSIFCNKIRDLIDHDELTLYNAELLKVGRHFRFSPDAKLIVGRNEKENDRLLKLAKEDDFSFDPVGVPGPIGIGKGSFNEDNIHTASRIIARYSDASTGQPVDISHKKVSSGSSAVIKASQAEEGELTSLRI